MARGEVPASRGARSTAEAAAHGAGRALTSPESPGDGPARAPCSESKVLQSNPRFPLNAAREQVSSLAGNLSTAAAQHGRGHWVQMGGKRCLPALGLVLVHLTWAASCSPESSLQPASQLPKAKTSTGASGASNKAPDPPQLPSSWPEPTQAQPAPCYLHARHLGTLLLLPHTHSPLASTEGLCPRGFRMPGMHWSRGQVQLFQCTGHCFVLP